MYGVEIKPIWCPKPLSPSRVPACEASLSSAPLPPPARLAGEDHCPSPGSAEAPPPSPPAGTRFLYLTACLTSINSNVHPELPSVRVPALAGFVWVLLPAGGAGGGRGDVHMACALRSKNYADCPQLGLRRHTRCRQDGPRGIGVPPDSFISVTQISPQIFFILFCKPGLSVKDSSFPSAILPLLWLQQAGAFLLP